MKRTPLRQRDFPNYSSNEEKANMLTHIIGGGFAVIIAVISVITAVIHRDAYAIVSASIFGFSIVALYSVSSIYHGLYKSTSKQVMRIIDHCTIYFLIAGTYTPILLSSIRRVNPTMAWAVFGVEWAMTALATVFTAIDLKKYKLFSMASYIGMGWCIVAVTKTTIEAISFDGFMWLLAGGIAYTIGAVLYGIGKKKRYFHTVFHILVIIGSILHGVCIIMYVL